MKNARESDIGSIYLPSHKGQCSKENQLLQCHQCHHTYNCLILVGSQSFSGHRINNQSDNDQITDVTTMSTKVMLILWDMLNTLCWRFEWHVKTLLLWVYLRSWINDRLVTVEAKPDFGCVLQVLFWKPNAGWRWKSSQGQSSKGHQRAHLWPLLPLPEEEKGHDVLVFCCCLTNDHCQSKWQTEILQSQFGSNTAVGTCMTYRLCTQGGWDHRKFLKEK